MFYTTIQNHADIADQGFHYIYYTNFDDCRSEIGGALYISSDSDVVVISCIFMKCKANTGSGRGSALYSTNGNIACQYSCSDNGVSSFGGDFQTGYDVKSIYFISMQLIHSSVKYHPTYLHSKNQVIKYSNWSQTQIEDSSYKYYAAILSLSNVQTVTAQFLNGINCYGEQALFSIEFTYNQSPLSLSHINACNNQGSKYIVALRGTSALNILMKNCNFYGNNDITDYYYLDKTASLSNLEFQNCLFSIQKIEASNIQIVDCEFNQNGVFIEIANECFAKIISTFGKNRIIIPKAFLFTMFSMCK